MKDGLSNVLDSNRIKNVLQYYGNVERLNVLNRKIRKSKDKNDLSELADNIILYHETLTKILSVYDSVLFEHTSEV